MFILSISEHLKAHGVDLKQSIIQTDNGTEFTTAWNYLENSSFHKVVKRVIGAVHRIIPPGEKTWQSDVKTSRMLIEDEFYGCVYFHARWDFRKTAAKYQRYFNHERMNSYKRGSPAQLLNSLSGEYHHCTY